MPGVGGVRCAALGQIERRATVRDKGDIHILSIQTRRAGECDDLARAMLAVFLAVNAVESSLESRVFDELHHIVDAVLICPCRTRAEIYKVRVVIEAPTIWCNSSKTRLS